MVNAVITVMKRGTFITDFASRSQNAGAPVAFNMISDYYDLTENKFEMINYAIFNCLSSEPLLLRTGFHTSNLGASAFNLLIIRETLSSKLLINANT
jgi:hypothetical protein